MDATEAVMCVLEGTCPKCDADVKLVEVGGTKAFLDDRFGTVERVVLVGPSLVCEAMMNVLSCKEEDLGIHLKRLRALMMDTNQPRLKNQTRKRTTKWDVPTGVKVNVWQDTDDPYEIGMEEFHCYDCGAVYEAYALAGGDWVLGGHPEFEQA